MKAFILIGWLALFGGLMYGTRPKEKSQILPLVNKATVELKAVKGISLVDGKPFTGTLFELSPRGDTSSLSGFENGREHGTWKTFYWQAKPRTVRQYQHGKKIGELKSWHENGTLMAEATFKNDEYDGVLKEWDENGQLVKTTDYSSL